MESWINNLKPFLLILILIVFCSLEIFCEGREFFAFSYQKKNKCQSAVEFH